MTQVLGCNIESELTKKNEASIASLCVSPFICLSISDTSTVESLGCLLWEGIHLTLILSFFSVYVVENPEIEIGVDGVKTTKFAAIEFSHKWKMIGNIFNTGSFRSPFK